LWWLIFFLPRAECLEIAMAKLPRTAVGRNECIGARRRSKKVDAPEVPTFRPSGETVVERPAQTAVAEDPTEEAVRRMVEAAYT
jgi:hypothetical protein